MRERLTQNGEIVTGGTMVHRGSSRRNFIARSLTGLSLGVAGIQKVLGVDREMREFGTYNIFGCDNSAPIKQEANRIILETDSLQYIIGTNGFNHAFQDRRSGKNYLDTADPGHFVAIEENGQKFGSTSVKVDAGLLQAKFGDSGVSAWIRARVLREYLTLELVEVSDQAVSIFHVADLSLTLTKYVGDSLACCRNDEYAAAVMSLNLETNSVPSRRKACAVLTASADQRVRLEGASVAILGCPTGSLLDLIEQVEIENGLPHPILGGVWARKSPEVRKSYLFVDLSEATADAMINYAKAGGFSYITAYDGVWNNCHGTYPVTVNRENFPNGDAGLKEVSRKIHAAGLKLGMHILGQDIDKDSPLVHPVPNPGLYAYPDRERTMAADLGITDTFIPTTTSPAGLLAKKDKALYFYGRDLRIDDEILVYDDLQTTEPYGFIGCKRGAYGTMAAAHRRGTAIHNLAQMVSGYHADWTGDLYDRIARAEGAALGQFQFDFIYTDGSGATPGYSLPDWYLSNLVFSKLYGYARREVMFGLHPPTDYTWHIFIRGNTVDWVKTGIIENFDRVSLAGAERAVADLQPSELGWFGYFTYRLDGNSTRPREMEYAWSKALAYGSAVSLETNKAALDGNGRTPEIFSIIKNWEELKLAEYFPNRIREEIRIPGKEFTLNHAADGKWEVLPVTYGPQKYVTSLDKQQNVWNFFNPYETQPLNVSIEAYPFVAEYSDRANVVVLEPAPVHLDTSPKIPENVAISHSDGVEYTVTASQEKFLQGGHSIEATARNQGSNPKGWGTAEVILDGAKDLSRHRALGTWVAGDSSGAYLHFIIEDSSRFQARDYYVRLDFTGWKYVKMAESAGGEIYDFDFPFSSYMAIRAIDFAVITRLYISLSNVPSGSTVKARFGRLEALLETSLVIRHPGLMVNGQSITFPVELGSDCYMEYPGGGVVRAFDANGFTKASPPPLGVVPLIRKGDNQVAFRCERGRNLGETAKVTIITRGQPLR
jgi:hypothetical protein